MQHPSMHPRKRTPKTIRKTVGHSLQLPPKPQYLSSKKKQDSERKWKTYMETICY